MSAFTCIEDKRASQNYKNDRQIFFMKLIPK